MLHSTQISKPAVLTATPNQFITRLARGISHVTAPPVLAIPTYIFLDNQYKLNRSVRGESWQNLGIAIFFGAVAPILVVLLLKIFKLVGDMHIMDRRQRTLPYCIAIASYTLGGGLLWGLYGWGLLSALLLCYALTTLLVMLINLRWKISAHATGASGTVAAIWLIAGWPVVLLLGGLALICWARLYLRAHTAGQLLSGSLLGFSLTILLLFVSGTL